MPSPVISKPSVKAFVHVARPIGSRNNHLAVAWAGNRRPGFQYPSSRPRCDRLDCLRCGRQRRLRRYPRGDAPSASFGKAATRRGLRWETSPRPRRRKSFRTTQLSMRLMVRLRDNTSGSIGEILRSASISMSFDTIVRIAAELPARIKARTMPRARHQWMPSQPSPGDSEDFFRMSWDDIGRHREHFSTSLISAAEFHGSPTQKPSIYPLSFAGPFGAAAIRIIDMSLSGLMSALESQSRSR